MANEMVSENGVHVAGEFQGWDPAATPASNAAYGVYSVTVSLPNGVHEYKFINGNEWGQDEVISGDCAASGTTNRFVTVAGGAVVTGTPCFGSCDDCAGCTDPMFAEYDPFAGSDNGSCATGVVAGCTYPDAENYEATANDDDGSCTFETGSSACPVDLDGDGAVATADLFSSCLHSASCANDLFIDPLHGWRRAALRAALFVFGPDASRLVGTVGFPTGVKATWVAIGESVFLLSSSPKQHKQTL